MALLAPEHASRYRSIAALLLKYGRSRDLRPDGDIAVEAEPPEEALAFARDIEALGPTFVKLGQLLSTRPDLLAAPYAAALARLQDDVEPMPWADVEAVFREELGMAPSDVFEVFDEAPLASASLGQVHAARLRTGREVVVKVQRPDVRERVATDMDALAEMASFLDAHTEAATRYGLVDLLAHFRATLEDELDYRREAANLDELREILAPYPRLVVPGVVAEATTRRVLTMDRVEGRKVTELQPVGRADVPGAALARDLFAAYLDQILVAGFLHADPHPGNVLLTPDGRLALIDLGMVGRIPEDLRDVLVRLLLAVGEGRGREAADLALELGECLPGAEPERFAREAARLVERNQGRGVGDLDAGALVLELTTLSAEAGVRLPAVLSMVGKALLNLDQVARALDPDFDPAGCVRERAESILVRRLQPSRERMLTAALDAKELVEELPGRVNRVLDALADGELRLRVDAIDERELLAGMQKIANRVAAGLLLAALVVGAALMARVEGGPRLLGYPAIALVAFVLAAGGSAALLGSMLVGDARQRRRLGRGRS